MIVSHQHRFVFLKTRKTAGTSIEIALSTVCGPDDVITGLVPEDEALRQASGGRGPQHDYFPLRSYTRRDWRRLVRHGIRARVINHMPASAVRRLVGQQVLDDYLVFTVERNPWDAALSFYHWKMRNRPEAERPSVSEWLRSPDLAQLAQNRDIYSIDGRSVADVVCRFESLNDDVEQVRQRLGLPEPLALQHAKGNVRGDRRGYRDVLDEDDAEVVRAAFAPVIRDLGYEF